MQVDGIAGKSIRLRKLTLSEVSTAEDASRRFRVTGSEKALRYSDLVSEAARAMFEMRNEGPMRLLPSVFEDIDAQALRVVYREIVVRFQPNTSAAKRSQLLGELKIRSKNPFVKDQSIVYHPAANISGTDLVEIANTLSRSSDVVFAQPNFVSEYHRSSVPRIHSEQWHLYNTGYWVGQTSGEDVDIRGAWATTLGRPGIVIAVLDDGVDVDHPNLKSRILKRPDPNEPRDECGRDFFVPSTLMDHFDPRPKRFQYPYDEMDGNDIHGTPCAGVVAASGATDDVFGAAPRCKLLPVKIFHGNAIATDSNVANAIRYAALFADIISCSWGGPYSPDIELAIQDAASGRKGKGVPVFCAAGNDGKSSVDYPARLTEAIAVGASTDKGTLASYSNRGAEISVVAPSSGGVSGIYTTDVAHPNRGFNTGSDEAGGADGLHTNDFGGTSSATPLAAAVAALVLSINPSLTREQVRQVLQESADKIGPASAYNSGGHSAKFGFGRVNAKSAVTRAASLRAANTSTRKKGKAPSRRRT